MITTKCFNLENHASFNNAELFKARLENAGYVVKITTHGFNGVKIEGVKT